MEQFKNLVRTTWHATPTAVTPAELSVKLQSLRTEIKRWQASSLGAIDEQTNLSTQALMWLTKAEESRQLTALELYLRKLLTERLDQIESISEGKWRQRAKRQWLKEGDRNTKFFHAVATQQKRSNSITSIMHDGAEVTQHSGKARIFFDYFANLIGSQGSQTVNFNLHTFYGTDRLSQSDIDSLQMPWTEQDIIQAISSWKTNKSPGPDGFTGEFYNAFILDIIPDLREVFSHLNAHPHLSLFPLNDSFIVLVPKKQPAVQPTDFRPISLVNAIQKIYSRIMAAKIKPILDRLLTPTQTGFLKNRSIMHGFYYAQQVIQAAAKQKVKLAVFKADVFKAFDTLNWKFLLQSLQARGFPQPWIQLIESNVLQGSSRVVINSIAGRKITLKRGVRQGDPISPYLFNLAVDFLPRWISKLNELLFLTLPFLHCKPCLLYADDTLLFLKPTRSQMLKTKLIFDIFGKLSGLSINFIKSELAITSSPLSLVQDLAAAVHCKSATFPIRYLGLPLSDKKLKKADYFPLIDRIQLSLTGWKATLLSVGGRAILTNAVLSAIPQYFMSVFLLPKWAVLKIDQIRRRFLWHGHRDHQGQKKGLYMVNWTLATKPRSLGGLGIRNLQIANQALLMKWMWLWFIPRNDWWKEATVMVADSDRPWNDPRASSFWKNIACIAPAFHCSVTHRIAQGNTVLFWHDSWCGKPLKYRFPTLYQAAINQLSSVQQNRTPLSWNPQFRSLDNSAQVQESILLSSLHNIHTTQGQDEINWLRNPPSSL